jgi:allantoicase
MKHKTGDLTGALLDAAVAKAEDEFFSEEDLMLQAKHGFAPSADWADGGPIIERERIELMNVQEGGDPHKWEAGFNYDHGFFTGPSGSGPTPLVAAMRAYVASKFGDKVDLP